MVDFYVDGILASQANVVKVMYFTYPIVIDTGEHEVYVGGFSNNYEFSYYLGYFTVNKADPAMSVVINPNSFVFGNNASVIVNLSEDATGNISYSFD